MPNEEGLSGKDLDYLQEMFNIGFGHAASALSQLLLCRIEMKIPHVYLTQAKRVPSVLAAGCSPVTCVKMGLLGDVRGDAFFVVSADEGVNLTRIAEKANLGRAGKGAIDVSVMEEIGNIITGVCLTAIHDFCKLNIYHSVPVTATDVFQAAIDETLADMSRRADAVLVVENALAVGGEGEFVSIGRQVRTFLVLFMFSGSIGTLVDSVRNAMPK